jgi:hypothetical protein
MAAREATAEDKGRQVTVSIGHLVRALAGSGRAPGAGTCPTPRVAVTATLLKLLLTSSQTSRLLLTAWQTCRVPATGARRTGLIMLAGIIVTGAGCAAGSTPGPPTPSVTMSSATTSADGNRSATCPASREGPPTGGTQYREEVEHDETYQGYRLIVISSEERPGSWTYRVDMLCDGERHRLLSNTGEVRYTSADEARRAALSDAAAAIDRMRAGRGKP